MKDILKSFEKDLKKTDCEPLIMKALLNNQELEYFQALSSVVGQKMNSITHKYHNSNYSDLSSIHGRLREIITVFALGRGI